MILLEYRQANPALARVVALFGVGLIGRSILRAVSSQYDTTLTALPFDWRRPDAQPAQLEAIAAGIADVCARASADGVRTSIAVVWAAGRAGFGALPEQAEAETAALGRVTAFTRGITERYLADTPVMFHMLSSAGGLYEGQRFVDGDTAVAPRRPYGRAKQAQEVLAEALPTTIPVRIYRPSTVVGDVADRGRKGLVATLAGNIRAGRTTHIYGLPTTLRDYVLATDVGQWIADRLFSVPPGRVQRDLLVSGKPSTVLEVIHSVETAMNARAYINFTGPLDNALHNTYRPSARPRTWCPTGLRPAVMRVAANYLADRVNRGT